MRAAGSSPRVRGTGNGGNGPFDQFRFIPACAGNRAFLGPIVTRSSVHPRVCGEQALYLGLVIYCTGSSPRVRGTAHSRLTDVTQQRFIPACAGNRLDAAQGRQTLSVHPRVCGEQLFRLALFKSAPGSSPRVRGTV